MDRSGGFLIARLTCAVLQRTHVMDCLKAGKRNGKRRKCSVVYIRKAGTGLSTPSSFPIMVASWQYSVQEAHSAALPAFTCRHRHRLMEMSHSWALALLPSSDTRNCSKQDAESRPTLIQGKQKGIYAFANTSKGCYESTKYALAKESKARGHCTPGANDEPVSRGGKRQSWQQTTAKPYRTVLQ